MFGLLEKIQRQNTVKEKYNLNRPSPTEGGERDFITSFNKALEKAGRPVTLVINGKKFKNIVGINKVPGTPKGDLVLVAYDRNKGTFSEVCWISHKKGSTAKDFGQWSGMTESAGVAIANHPLVQKYIQLIKKYEKDTFLNPEHKATLTVAQKIEGEGAKQLINMAVYGPDYGKSFGVNNVNYIMQGTPRVNSLKNGEYELSVTGHIYENGDTVSDSIAFMSYRKGAKADRATFGVGARTIIQDMKSRPVHYVIDARGRLNKRFSAA